MGDRSSLYLTLLVAICLISTVICYPGAPFTEKVWFSPTIAAPPLRQRHTIVAMDNFDEVVLIGGSDGGSSVNCEVFGYDEVGDSWTVLAPMPTGTCVQDHTSILWNNRAYTFGGRDSVSTKNAFQYYSQAGDAWTTVTGYTGTPPSARRGHVAARRYASTSSSAYMIVTMGAGDGSVTQTTHKYTFNTNAWTEIVLADPPAGRVEAGGAMRDDGCFFLYGGMNPFTSEYYDDFWMFCEGDAAWTEITPEDPAPLRLTTPAMWTDDGRVLMFGGFTGVWPDTYLNIIQEYNQFHNTWHTVDLGASPLPTARHTFGFINRNEGGHHDLTVVSGRSKYVILQDLWGIEYTPIHCPVGEVSLDGIVCTECEVGYYADNTGMYACLPCPDGTFAANTGQDLCTPCPAGTYGNGTNHTSEAAGCIPCPIGHENPFTGRTDLADCTECQPGSYAENNGTDTCSTCPAGSYSTVTGAINDTDCQQCGPGTFSSAGDGSCTQCPAGTASDGNGVEVCPDCLAGQWSALGAETCEDCPKGQYTAAPGTPSCTNCPTGEYQDDTGKDACIQCPEGTYNSQTGRTALSDCVLCGAGTANPNKGGTAVGDCVACIPGTYNPDTGQATCTDCNPGYYNPDTGSDDVSACVACVPGTNNPNPGEDDISACVICPAGTWSDTAAPTCTDCIAGKYSPDPNQVAVDACIDCPAYTKSDAGSDACTSCGANKWSPEGSPVCFECVDDPDKCTCEAGWYLEINPAGNCHPCEVGNYCVIGHKVPCPLGQMSFGRSTACMDCLDGWICDSGIGTPCFGGEYAHDHIECRTCVTGAACNAGFMTVCPVGHWGNGTEYCYPCLPGTITDTPGRSSCDACGDGTTSNFRRDHCVECPAGEYSTGGAACVSCAEGSYAPTTGASACLPCPVGEFGPIGGLKACHACPEGTTTPDTGAILETECV